MEFEDLQAIWDTQNERPVFAINDSRLAVALYQQREHRRRRLFQFFFIPYYGVSLGVVAANALLFLAFFLKTAYRVRTSDPLMSVWDGAALVAVIAGATVLAVRVHAERRRHERTQRVFAPSLREELEQGISQLDFELSLHSAGRARQLICIVALGTLVFVWETGRLNGDPTPWMMLAFNLVCVFPSIWYGAAAEKAAFEKLMQRKRALESMRAALVDGAATVDLA